jgi:hypothetical protein
LAEPTICAATTTSPFGAAATAVTRSSDVPPSRRAQISAPVPEYLATKPSVPPALVSVVPPKSTLLRNAPPTSMLPLASTATVVARSPLAAPSRRAHVELEGGTVVDVEVVVGRDVEVLVDVVLGRVVEVEVVDGRDVVVDVLVVEGRDVVVEVDVLVVVVDGRDVVVDVLVVEGRDVVVEVDVLVVVVDGRDVVVDVLVVEGRDVVVEVDELVLVVDGRDVVVDGREVVVFVVVGTLVVLLALASSEPEAAKRVSSARSTRPSAAPRQAPSLAITCTVALPVPASAAAMPVGRDVCPLPARLPARSPSFPRPARPPSRIIFCTPSADAWTSL